MPSPEPHPPPEPAPAPRPAPTRPASAAHGELRFVAGDARHALVAEWRARGILVVEVPGPSAGRLSEAVDEGVERALRGRGAGSPGIGSGDGPDAALSDQLFRARRAGAEGLAIALGPLGVSARSPAIASEDAATLGFYAAATRDRPLWLALDEADRRRPAFVETRPLDEALEPAPVAPSVEASPAPPVPAPAPAAVEPELPPAPPVPAPAPPRAPRTAFDPAFRHWVAELTAARGPQPLSAIERLFARAYVPLAGAIAQGLDDARALAAHEEFQRAFVKSYTDACPTFAITGKRPRMVLDAFDLAGRAARLHAARSTQLLLVDAMRADLGALVRDRLVERLGVRASLTEETTLFSALPTTTPRQLEALGRGIDALRTSTEAEGTESLRGRTAEYVRRLRLGSRDLLKLDVVESRLREADTGVYAELPQIADAVAGAIARHADTLKTRTLLYVFGDHGFTLQRDGSARQGGATPEEVIVPAYAFLLGELH